MKKSGHRRKMSILQSKNEVLQTELKQIKEELSTARGVVKQLEGE